MVILRARARLHCVRHVHAQNGLPASVQLQRPPKPHICERVSATLCTSDVSVAGGRFVAKKYVVTELAEAELGGAPGLLTIPFTRQV